MRTADDIAGLYEARLTKYAPRHERMRRVSAVYNDAVNLPLPELSANEKAAVPNLVQQGTDQMARRAASVLPNLTYPALRPGIKVSEERADARRMVNYGWWEKTRIRKVNTKSCRQFITYSSAPRIVRPDPVTQCPKWEPHSPFDVFPSPLRFGSFTPTDVIVRQLRDARWLADNYPDQYVLVNKKQGCGPDDTFEVLEYIDDSEVVFVLMGHRKDNDPEFGGYQRQYNGLKAVELARYDNRAGVCWAVIPERPALDAPIGHFDGVIGMYETQATLMAMEVIATRRAIWPDVWLENPNNAAQPNVVQRPDPSTGEPGIITNGRLNTINLDPSYRASNVRDQLEYAQRQTAGLPSELGGSSQTNVRTGRRGAQILSASIDFTIAEVQDALAEALHEENQRAIEIDKGYFNFSKSFYVSTKGARGEVSYTPSETFETSQHVVEYPIAGTDLSDLVINGGQRVSMGTMAKRSFMDIDPLVADSGAEEQRIKFEGMEAAFFNALQTEAAMPEGPWQSPDMARLAKLMFGKEQMTWYEAVEALQAEKQAEQAEGAEPGSPETMPGLAMPGQGAEIPAVPDTSPSADNMASILSQLGTADQALRMR